MKNKKTVLIIEDDVIQVSALRHVLENAGFKVVVVNEGERAVDAIKNEKPDAVLLDIILPRKSGFEILSILNKEKIVERYPVIILSNLAQNEEIVRGLSLGAKDFIVKSNINITEIPKKIAENLKKK